MISGALEGLNHYLNQFQPSEHGDTINTKIIFDYTKKALLSDTDDINRYAMPRGILIEI